MLEFFVREVTARAAADLTGFQVNTVTLFYRKGRLLVAKKLEVEASGFTGEIELDESYFGGVRKGKRGRGAAGKVPGFGILKRGGKVYTQVIDNTRTNTVRPIIRSKVRPDSIVYIDSYRSYNWFLKECEFRFNYGSHQQQFRTLKKWCDL